VSGVLAIILDLAVSSVVMDAMRGLSLLFLCLSLAPLGAQTPAAPKVPLGVRSTITFQEPTPQAGTEQLKLRLRLVDEPAPYDLSQETFEILVPKGYKEGDPHGLFIWISPGPKPNLNEEWEKVLAKEKLIFIGAVNSGNNRETPDRIRLAVDANHHLRQLYTVNPDRVYVSGHSGGGRVASMVGVAYADMFTGTASFMGANFFRTTQGKDGSIYEMRYFPHPEIAMIAQQQNRFALITGDKDSNLDNTRAVYEQGFKAEGFKEVKLFEIPNQGHNAPDAKWLGKVIQFLDTGK
jgi:dienelactone hydrolase